MKPNRRYQQLADEFLALPGVTMGKALSNDVLKIDGKIFAFLTEAGLVVKVPSVRVAQLIDAGGEPFHSGGRRMKEWVAVADQGQWHDLMAEAMAFVAPP